MMPKLKSFLILLVVISFLAPGCVAKSKYVKQQEELENLQAELKTVEEERDKLAQENPQLKAELQKKETKIKEMSSTYDDLVSGLKSEIEAGEVKMTQIQNRLSVQLVDKILFDSGSSKIKDAGKDALKTVGTILNEAEGKRIQVEGHTDNVPISMGLLRKYPTNWELSSARALNVVRFLQEDVGIDPGKLSAAAYGEYQPVESNETPEGRHANRRIEIVLLPEVK